MSWRVPLLLTHCKTLLISIQSEHEFQHGIPQIGQILVAQGKAIAAMGLYCLPKELLVLEAVSNQLLDPLYSINDFSESWKPEALSPLHNAQAQPRGYTWRQSYTLVH